MKNKWFNLRCRIIAATPMICIIVYLAIGFIWDIWHPTWAIFFLIPLMPFLLGSKSLTQVISYPLICLAAFLALGFTRGWWHPGWLVFLTIPVYYTLIPQSFRKKKNKEIDVDFSD